MDPTFHPVTAQAVSGQEQRGWKASAVRMERRVPDASPCSDWDLVCAGPGMRRSFFISYNARSDGGDQREAHYRAFHQVQRQRMARISADPVWFQ